MGRTVRVSVKPRTLPEHSQNSPRNSPEQPWNTPGTSHNTPEHPRNRQEHSQNTKIVVSGQTALTKPKTSEDSQFFRRLLRITLIDEISEQFRNASEYFRSFWEQRKNQYLMGKIYYTRVLHINKLTIFNMKKGTVELLILHWYFSCKVCIFTLRFDLKDITKPNNRVSRNFMRSLFRGRTIVIVLLPQAHGKCLPAGSLH